jgi:hypothetical protein
MAPWSDLFIPHPSSLILSPPSSSGFTGRMITNVVPLPFLELTLIEPP